jgi:hypothetical protein
MAIYECPRFFCFERYSSPIRLPLVRARVGSQITPFLLIPDRISEYSERQAICYLLNHTRLTGA